MGVDPGFAALGVGILDYSAGKLAVCHHETLRTAPGTADAERLDAIGERLWALAREFKPDAIGYEDQAGVETAARMGRGRLGSSSSSRRVHEVVGAIRGLALGLAVPLYCLAPSTVKVAVLGRGGGRSSKAQMKEAIGRLFGVVRCSEHSADALAVTYGAMARARRHR